MAIAGQADIFEVHVRGLYTCLIEPLGCAMGVRTVIARLSRYIENRDTLNMGSPILPLFGPWPGHCVCFVYCGQVLCGVAGGRPLDQTSSINDPVRGGAMSPSTPGT